MEPVTHLMTGACLSRAGLNRKAAYATLAMTLAAEAPDLDVLWRIRGPIAAFQHHRGWTHTLLGVPFEACIVVGLVWLLHRWRLKRAAIRDRTLQTAAPVRWGWLWLLSVIALLSHILLDWTNNYGVRPFFPFSPRWYAGSIVFIFEPVLFVLLLGALVLPSLFGLVSSEVGAKRQLFRGRGLAIAALIGIVALWGWRLLEQQNALTFAASNADPAVPITRAFASPYPVNPYRWHIVLDTPGYYQMETVDLLRGTITSNTADRLYKPPTTLFTLPAKRTWLGRVYLDWSPCPIVTDLGPNGDNLTEVTFTDPRFQYDAWFLHGRDHPPLSGEVLFNSDRRVVQQSMDGAVQH